MSSLYKRMVHRSQSHQKRNACDRKVPYQTEADALFAIASLQVDQDLDPGTAPHVPYKCQYCRSWHFTSHPRER